MAFSFDSSLLSIGYGSTLCVYAPETLRLKCVLSPPNSLDGGANKIIINLPHKGTEKMSKSPSKDKHERRQNMLKLVKGFLENDDQKLIKEIKNQLEKLSLTKNTEPLDANDLLLKEQETVFKQILAHNELNFFQKIELFEKLNIHGNGSEEIKQKYVEYYQNHVTVVKRLENSLVVRSQNLSEKSKYSVSRKFFNYSKRKIGNRHKSVKSIFNFGSSPRPKRKLRNSESEQNNKNVAVDSVTNKIISSVSGCPQIKHISFGTGEYAHLVIEIISFWLFFLK